ncbi:MAG: M28 family peptidase [Cyclobacteriaceae bacterium]
MKYTAIILVLVLLGCAGTNQEKALSIDEAMSSINAKEYKNHVAYLSSDELAGRYPGKAGYDTAAAYIEQLVKDMGLQPGGSNNTYRQPIEFTEATIKPAAITAKLDGKPLEHGKDFLMGADHEDVSFSGDIVFIGSGIDAPELGYSDLENVDVAGKVVMYFARSTPEHFGLIERAVHVNLARDRLMKMGAVGTISIIPPEMLSSRPWPLITWLVSRPSMQYVAESDVPYRGGIVVSYKTAASWFEKDGRKLSDALKSLKEGTPTSYETSLTLEVNASSDRKRIVSDNVAAIKVGSDPVLKDEFLVITAHLDHDGISNPVENDSIYNGTIDNASGSAALLVLADKFSRMDTKRSIMFLWVTAEERGLLGSEYFAKFPTIDASKIVANQNMDGIVSLIVGTRDMLAYGYEHSNLSQSVDYALEKLGMERSEDTRPEETFFVRSDQYSFIAEGIPAIWILGGNTALADSVDAGAELDKWLVTRYHRPNDDMDQPLDFEAATTELKCNLLVADHIVNQIEAVQWNKDGFLYKTFAENKDE